ncbi:heparinase II/III domain-containing protein [Methylocaldum sp.]|uniref:heparinase II/III domain-containing protein n=1 Tax=Methylocaldum sp. TaxID=1969727 RepID=UPI002D723D5C|nr:heparinase II/III family protein [Methylocaldum sp.]HYE35027.1 heparinase II/III family protein [Methylocaldum sp.]
MRYLRLWSGLALVLAGAVFAPTAVGETGPSPSLPGNEDIKAAFAALKAGEGGYAPARAAREYWDAARRRVAQDPRWTAWLQERTDWVDNWMTTTRDRADWVAGWMHDYVDPNTGALLHWTPDQPIPPDEPGNEKLRAAWIAHNRTYNIDRVLDAARLFRLTTGNTRYFDWAASQLDFYADAYRGFPLRNWNGQARLMSQSLDEATRGLVLIEAVRLLRPQLPTARADHWRDGLFLPLAANVMASSREVHNIAVWHAAAVTLIGLEFQQPELIQFGKTSALGIPSLLTKGVSPDWFWYENSISYQDYVVQALVEMLVGASLRGRLDEFTRELWIAQNLMIAPMTVRFAHENAPTPNDSQPDRKAPNRKLWAASRRVLPTWIGLDEAKKLTTWDTLLDPPKSVASVPALPDVVSGPVPGLDAVQIVKNGWHALLRYGQKAKFHAQQESLAYDLQYGDTWILKDAGTVGYGSPLHNNYFRRAPAQNVPLVDGDGQNPWPSEGQLDDVAADGSSAAVSHPNYRPGVTAARRLAIGPNGFVDTVQVKTASETPHAIGVVMNTACAVAAVDQTLATGPSLPTATAFRHWKNWVAYSAPGTWSATLDCAGQRFALTISGSSMQRAYVGTVPDSAPPYTRRGLYVEALAREAQFTLAFRPLELPQASAGPSGGEQ